MASFVLGPARFGDTSPTLPPGSSRFGLSEARRITLPARAEEIAGASGPNPSVTEVLSYQGDGEFPHVSGVSVRPLLLRRFPLSSPVFFHAFRGRLPLDRGHATPLSRSYLACALLRGFFATARWPTPSLGDFAAESFDGTVEFVAFLNEKL